MNDFGLVLESWANEILKFVFEKFKLSRGILKFGQIKF